MSRKNSENMDFLTSRTQEEKIGKKFISSPTYVT